MVILAFNALNDQSVISSLFKAAGFTYGPLLGLFAFGLFTRRQIKDHWAPFICFLTPVLSFALDVYSEELLGGFEFGFFILLVNGFLTFLGLWLISKPSASLGALTWYDRKNEKVAA